MNISKPLKILIELATLWFTIRPLLFIGVIVVRDMSPM